MRIVGTGLTPMSESLGHGATITLAGLRLLNPGANGGMWFVRLEPGADNNAVIDAFGAAFPGSTRSDIAPFDIDSTANPTLNLDQVGSVPAFFALIMGLMAAGVLAHVLVVATRARRRELAILRALGFSRGQTLRAIAWQSTIYAIGALAIGLPTGIALGRITWRAYAANLGAVPEPVTPVLACAVVVAAALALAILLSLVPGRRAARANPSALLRTE
jgi:ABC-type antimicrobial peptide transport system permease subunit